MERSNISDEMVRDYLRELPELNYVGDAHAEKTIQFVGGILDGTDGQFNTDSLNRIEKTGHVMIIHNNTQHHYYFDEMQEDRKSVV